MKIMSKSASRHQVTLQGKLEITDKEKDYLHKVLLHFSVFQCISHQPTSADHFS
jgi:hypothetical protein